MANGSGKNKVVAGVLGIVLGGLGIHHFYLGSTMSGVIMLCVSLLSCGMLAIVPSILGLVEGIMLLIMPDPEFDARYNQRKPESIEFVFMKK